LPRQSGISAISSSICFDGFIGSFFPAPKS
jgi:hypothetical protein